MSELRNIVQSNDLPDGVKAIVGPEVYQLMLKQASQPRLTIPKSIAEQADKIAYYALKKEGAEEFHQWFDYKQDEYMDVVFAYLNPLTRDLVKVVEG